MEDMIIKTRSLTKVYKTEKAVNKVNLNIAKGDIYGLVGENGSGKSTILKMILGIANPSDGEVMIFGKTGDDLLKSRRKIGSIVESPSFYPYLSAKDNLEYYRIQRGIVENNIEEILKTVGLEDTGKKKFKSFSLGMKQRLGLGLALMIDPEILILDEPINGLDPTGIVELRKLLLRLNRERGTTILISSHILGELSQIGSRYGFINKGVLLKEISSKELEEECKEYLDIKVENVEKASVLLERQLKTLNYKVTEEGHIYLYDFIDRPEIVVEEFSREGLYIKSIETKGVDLENYYLDLIGGHRND